MKSIKIKAPVSYTNIDKVIELDAQPIKLFPWIKTVIHKHLNFDVNGEWVVAEFTTGTQISSEITRREAMRSARRKLEFHGEENTKSAIEQFIKERKQYNAVP